MVTFTFDEVNKWLVVDLPTEEVTIQQIVDAVRDWQDEQDNLDIEDFILPSGKQGLGAGSYVGITLEFRYGWKLKFADRAGPTWTNCYVRGGNLVATYDPIYPAAYTNTVISQSSSATMIGVSADDLTFMKRFLTNKMTWDELNSRYQIWNDAGDAVLYNMVIMDKFDNPVVLSAGAIAQRNRVV
jgi:hypothetical protein